jgi:hypothetical protein
MKCIFRSFAMKCFVGVSFLSSCSPAVYLIDRQTVLELEASGEWQELDQVYQKKQLATGPLPLEKTKTKLAQNAVFTMTHGDSDRVLSVPENKAPNKKDDKR